MKTLKIALLSIVMVFVGNTVFATSAYAAETENEAATCIQSKGGKAHSEGTKTLKTCNKANDLANKINSLVKIITGLVGAVAVGMMVFGGFKYITSQGDPRKAEEGKNVIWYSGIGLFIVLLAYMIFDLIVKGLGQG